MGPSSVDMENVGSGMEKTQSASFVTFGESIFLLILDRSYKHLE